MTTNMNVPGYDKLADVLHRAYEQAAVGKGAERHADDKPFDQQPMQLIADRRGIGFILGQADKKSEEAQGMLDRGDAGACIRELLGAINYLAGAIIWIERRHKVSTGFSLNPFAGLDGPIVGTAGPATTPYPVPGTNGRP